MSWSLKLHNGDFTASGASLGTVNDEQKLVQDLRCAILEPMGTDSLHPEYGSLIDGGVTLDGAVAPGVIGLSPRQAATIVESEIQRLSRNYQNQQLNRAKDDRLTYGRMTLSSAEALIAVRNIQITQEQDALMVLVSLETARGGDITVAFPVTNS